MNAELAIAYAFHFAICRVEFDPVSVSPVSVARVQLRRMAVRSARQGIERSAGDLAQAPVMGRKARTQIRGQIQMQETLQATVYLEKILPMAIWGDTV